MPHAPVPVDCYCSLACLFARRRHCDPKRALKSRISGPIDQIRRTFRQAAAPALQGSTRIRPATPTAASAPTSSATNLARGRSDAGVRGDVDLVRDEKNAPVALPTGDERGQRPRLLRARCAVAKERVHDLQRRHRPDVEKLRRLEAAAPLARIAAPANPAPAEIPEGLCFEEAAALPFGAVTALVFLHDLAELRAGERLAVVGASGSVGVALVQIGRDMGATVTGRDQRRKRRSRARAGGRDGHRLPYRVSGPGRGTRGSGPCRRRWPCDCSC